MPGFLLHLGATVMCVHGGQAQPTAVSPRVLVNWAAGNHAQRLMWLRLHYRLLSPQMVPALLLNFLWAPRAFWLMAFPCS